MVNHDIFDMALEETPLTALNINDLKEEAPIDLNQNRRKNKRKKRKKRFFRLFVIIGLIVIFLISPFSNVSEIKVSPTKYISSEEVIKKSGISTTSKFLFVNNIFKSKIDHPLVKSYSFHNNYLGQIYIKVEEKRSLGYIIREESIALLTEEGKIESIKQLNDYIIALPKINNNDESFLKALSGHLKLLNDGIISRISEIDIKETTYDKNSLKLKMEDGNEVYASMKDLQLLENYNTILGSNKEKKLCIQLDGVTNSVHLLKCGS